MGTFNVTRRQTISADPAAVHGLVNDFHEWSKWSPWELIDPEMTRTYSGADSGVGAGYAWSGNRKAGAGDMTITDSSPEEIKLDINFTKPFKTSNKISFEFKPSGDTAEVVWTMTGVQRGLWALIGKIMPMDRIVGKDFEKGLTSLKMAAETP